jgi:hypothetical protein
MLHTRRLCVVDRLERAVAFEHVTSETNFIKIYGPHWPQGSSTSRLCCRGERVPAVRYLRTELDNLNGEAKQLQEHIHREQRRALGPDQGNMTETPLANSIGEDDDRTASYEPPAPEFVETSTSSERVTYVSVLHISKPKPLPFFDYRP